jgi:quercetin dioxygenase-like cupin family protein
MEPQREIVEFVEECGGIYFRSILFNKGRRVPQHAHDHDHATYCGAGSAVWFVEGMFRGIVTAGHAVEIKAGKQHEFEALEDGTRLACVHDVKSAERQKTIPLNMDKPWAG